jgi:hypothetical protein
VENKTVSGDDQYILPLCSFITGSGDGLNNISGLHCSDDRVYIESNFEAFCKSACSNYPLEASNLAVYIQHFAGAQIGIRILS